MGEKLKVMEREKERKTGRKSKKLGVMKYGVVWKGEIMREGERSWRK